MRNLIFFFVLLLSCNLNAQVTPIHHKLDVFITPAKSLIKVTDQITFQDANIDPVFSINSQLKITEYSPNVSLQLLDAGLKASDFGMDRDDAGDNHSKLQLQKYRIVFKEGKAGDSPLFEVCNFKPLLITIFCL
jgi:hypothetical protein